MSYDFEWDEKKNNLNRLNHGIDFADAVQVSLMIGCSKGSTIDSARKANKIERSAYERGIF